MEDKYFERWMKALKQSYQKASEHFKNGRYVGAAYALGIMKGQIDNVLDHFEITDEQRKRLTTFQNTVKDFARTLVKDSFKIDNYL